MACTPVVDCEAQDVQWKLTSKSQPRRKWSEERRRKKREERGILWRRRRRLTGRRAATRLFGKPKDQDGSRVRLSFVIGLWEMQRAGKGKKNETWRPKRRDEKERRRSLFFFVLDVCVERDMWQVGEKKKKRQNDAAWRGTFALKTPPRTLDSSKFIIAPKDMLPQRGKRYRLLWWLLICHCLVFRHRSRRPLSLSSSQSILCLVVFEKQGSQL